MRGKIPSYLHTVKTGTSHDRLQFLHTLIHPTTVLLTDQNDSNQIPLRSGAPQLTTSSRSPHTQPSGIYASYLFASPFLALLDFVSRATVMAQASVVRRPSSVRPSVRPSVRRPSVRKLKFLGNRCMDPGQILWEATYPPYLQTFFFVFFLNFQFSNFYDFFSFSLTWDPMGAKISKRYSSSFHPI